MRVGRPRVRRSLEREFWEQVPRSGSWSGAGAAIGVSVDVVARWVAESGGVKPRLVEPARSLSYRERCRIEALHAAGHSRADIARRLGRHRSTIGRELDRNGTRRVRRDGYSAANAQSKADAAARRPKPAKLATQLPLRRQVQDRLRLRHSPEQIARRLREEFPEDPEMWVSHETIYQSLYVQSRGGLKRELARHLRTGRTLRKPHRQAGQRRERFAGMVMISERPAAVEDRAVPGHWEGDLILGSTESGSAVGTLVERTTRFVMLLHLPGGHTADIVQEAMVAKMATLPEQLRRSLTWDQGSEMANHVQIAQATGLSIYFCDPHSPWQRGTNENTNGLLRQYLPKGEDLSFYGPGLLDQIASELNDRPRKTLNWRTPAETLDALLSGKSGPPAVATTG
jgi:transposase, IS30 family